MSPAQSGFDCRLSIGHTLKQCQKVNMAQWISKESLNALLKVAGFPKLLEWDLPNVSERHTTGSCIEQTRENM